VKVTLKSVLDSIPHGHIFDAHTVMLILLQKHVDIYLASLTGENVESQLSIITKYIKQYESSAIKRIGVSYSKNIQDGFTECACWQKL